jgi:hypothetical protein
VARSLSRSFLLLALGASIASATAAAGADSAAAVQDDPHAACAAPPSYVPADLLERPLPLRKGIGNSHEAVTTKSPEAAAYFDQGLNYLESYVWIEAA